MCHGRKKGETTYRGTFNLVNNLSKNNIFLNILVKKRSELLLKSHAIVIEIIESSSLVKAGWLLVPLLTTQYKIYILSYQFLHTKGPHTLVFMAHYFQFTNMRQNKHKTLFSDHDNVTIAHMEPLK